MSHVLCAHDYGLMRDSCPGCNLMEETPHVADIVSVKPAWSNRTLKRCRHCAQTRSHKIHIKAGDTS